MTGGRSGALARQVWRLFEVGTVSGLSEGQLLDRFLARGDEVAFEAIVARHGPMVLGVCRQFLRDPNDVDDAFQATFLVLVRKAESIRRTERLGSWLHGVARRVAVRARRGERKFRELGDFAAELAPCSVEERELREALHQEVDRLPARYREPIVLCCLEGLSSDEAAARLSWPVGTVRGRTSRGRDLLRGRLARRGFAPAGAIAALAAAPGAKAAVPEALANVTVRAAASLAAGAPLAGLVSTHVLNLTHGAISIMFLNPIKLGAVALATAGAFTVGAWALAYQGNGPSPKTAAKAEPKAAAPTVLNEVLVRQFQRPSPEDQAADDREKESGKVDILEMEVEAEKLQLQSLIGQIKKLENQFVTDFANDPASIKNWEEDRTRSVKKLTLRLVELQDGYLADKAKLARLRRLLTESQPPRVALPSAHADKFARRLALVPKIEEQEIEIELLEMEIRLERRQIASDFQVLKETESHASRDFAKRGDGRPPTKEALEEAEGDFQAKLKKLREDFERIRRKYLADKIKLAEKRIALAQFEQAGLPPEETKPDADLTRRLNEVEKKLDLLIEAAKGGK